QARGLRARRHVAAQLHAAARPGQGRLRPRHQERSEARQAHRYAGLHVRDPLPPASHPLRGRTGDAAGGLRRLLGAARETLHGRKMTVASRLRAPAYDPRMKVALTTNSRAANPTSRGCLHWQVEAASGIANNSRLGRVTPELDSIHSDELM